MRAGIHSFFFIVFKLDSRVDMRQVLEEKSLVKIFLLFFINHEFYYIYIKVNLQSITNKILLITL